MRQHRVTFFSPGTLFAETSSDPIDSWDTRKAVSMAARVKERHGAGPYGFKFSTFITHGPINVDGETLQVGPRMIEESGMHFITGEIFSIEDLEALSDPELRILISNMKWNNYPIVIRNDNSYRIFQPFRENDVVVDRAGSIIERGDTPERIKYRADKKAERQVEMDAWRKEYGE